MNPASGTPSSDSEGLGKLDKDIGKGETKSIEETIQEVSSAMGLEEQAEVWISISVETDIDPRSSVAMTIWMSTLEICPGYTSIVHEGYGWKTCRPSSKIFKLSFCRNSSDAGST